jgi:hypothetical protein
MGETTPTDTRSQRSQASRRGGQLLTRARSTTSKNGLPVLVPQTPLSRTVAPYSTGPAGVIGTATDVSCFIPDTNAIESVNARIRKAVKARGHFPTEAAAVKCVYLAIMSLDPTGKGRQRWSNRWKGALNAFTLAFPGRIISSTK